jgi:hypothetical protein
MSSVLARLIDRTGLSWYRFTAIVTLTLFFLAFATAYLDGIWDQFFSADHWRTMLFAPVIMAYMLSIIPPLGESSERAIAALRPYVPLDDKAFAQLLRTESGTTPRGEWIALAVGAVFGFLPLAPWAGGEGFAWIAVYWYVANPVVMSLLAWCIYVAFASSKPVAVIHRHLSDIDPFDLSPFEPVGRQGLVSSLAFVGGGALSVLFQLGDQDLLETSALIVHGALILIAVFVFFHTMRHTHRVLSQAKAQELGTVRQHIVAAYRSVAGLAPGSQELSTLSTKLGFWKEYETRVKATRTWPYDLGMLRTLFLSVLTPVAINLVQRLIGLLFS